MAKARGLCPLGLWSGLHCIAALRTHAGVYRALVQSAGYSTVLGLHGELYRLP